MLKGSTISPIHTSPDSHEMEKLAVGKTVTKSLGLFVFTMLQLNYFNEAPAVNTSLIF